MEKKNSAFICLSMKTKLNNQITIKKCNETVICILLICKVFL